MKKSYRRSDHQMANAEKWRRIAKLAVNAEKGKLPVLTEMSMSLDTFIEKVDALHFEIVENWCLCKWCQMFDPSNQHFNHWKKELAAHMKFLHRPMLKNHISKRKHIAKVFIDDYDLNEKDMVVRNIYDKFIEEQIDNNKQINAVAEEFAKSVNALIDAIANEANYSISVYVQRHLGEQTSTDLI